jgi:hypothetical protein
VSWRNDHDPTCPLGGSRVYVVSATGSRLVKIGVTTNLKVRLAALQQTSPSELVVLWHTSGGLNLERAIHQRFWKKRLHGEWFDFGTRNPVKAVQAAVAELGGAVAADAAIITARRQRYARPPRAPGDSVQAEGQA